MHPDFKTVAIGYAARVEQMLKRVLPADNVVPQRLHQAMRYSVLGGGKRLRALLVYSAGSVAGAPLDMLDAPACAVELLHAYSLIHDDLPAMDDDDLRRGKPSCHKAYDEATAILAGDALQSLAFHVISAPSQRGTPAKQRIELIHCFADASGSMGMCGGQALDLEAEDATLTLKDLEAVHLKKTGALIRASVQMGALSAPDVDEELVDNLDRYARSVGLAFQIRDDILDIEGDTQTLGKPQGSDVAQHKSTYPALLGLQESKDLADELNRTAQASIRALGDEANPLRWLADFAVSRSV